MQQSVSTPRTAAELQALRARRDELSQQINSISDRRSRVNNERFQAQVNQNPALVAEHDAQIKELGARLKRLETEKLAADDAIAAALPRVAAGSEAATEAATEAAIEAATSNEAIEAAIRQAIATVPPPDPAFRSRAVGRMMMLEAVVLILVGVVAWRWALRRALRRERTLTGEQDTALRQAVDSIAIEVERISENQRYVTRLLTEQNQAGLNAPAGKSPERQPIPRDSR